MSEKLSGQCFFNNHLFYRLNIASVGLMLGLFLSLHVYAYEDLAQSQIITLPMPDKISAYGEFYPGEQDKPAILILHGFLLTHNFLTVKRLAESLHDSGYTVLAPTLSLGINKRKTSLSCEAIHSHSLNDDLLELNQWVNWLKNKTHKDIILMGHSAGSSLIIAYIHKYNDTGIKHIVFLSMPNFGGYPNSFATQKDVELARNANNNPDKKDKLHKFSLSYCKNYVTTPRDFLSYYQLSKTNLYQYLKQSHIQKTLILGSKDSRVDIQWNKSLAATGLKLVIIEGANHFFDSEYEFDLLDEVENILNGL